MSQAFQSTNQIASQALWFQAVEVVPSQLLIGRAAIHDMVDRDEQRMPQCDQGSFLTTPSGQATILGRRPNKMGRSSLQARRTPAPFQGFVDDMRRVPRFRCASPWAT